MSSNLDRLLEWYRQRKQVGDASLEPTLIQSVAILGAGVMGIEIAGANLHFGLRVVMTDTNLQSLAAVPTRISSELAKYEQRGGASERVEISIDDDRLAACDLILETVVEDVAVKRRLYGRLEPRLASGSLLGTNTSTIPIGELATELKRPERFCGIHFCHPVAINPLIEIIPGPKTSAETISAAVDYARRLGKMPIVVEDGPGFLVNRLLLRYNDEAIHLLLDGAGVEQVDRVATEFGMAMGPFRILDEIGLDTSLSAGKVLLNAYPDRVAKLPILPLLVKRKQLGQKSGGGFYCYERTTPEGPFEKSVGLNTEATEIIEHYAKRENPPSEEEILHRLLLAMLLEATIILQEKKRLDPREIDLSMICGLGFPQEKGGLLHWADEIGAGKILEMVESFESLGKRFEPTPMLRELAKSGKRFYE